MIGITSTHEPIRGLMAQEMHERKLRTASDREQGRLKRTRPSRVSTIKLVEITNA